MSLLRLRGRPGGVPSLVPGSAAYGTWAATSQPATQGNPADYGYGLDTIANWTVVPWRDITTAEQVRAIAIHTPTPADYAAGFKTGMQGVTMSADNGPWVDCPLTYVAEDNCYQYCATIAAEPLVWSDGPHEIRFIATPRTGVPLVGQGATGGLPVGSMTLNTNFGGTLATTKLYASPTGNDGSGDGSLGNPYLTASKVADVCIALNGNAGGGTALLLAGSYTMGKNPENFGRSTGNRLFSVEAAPSVSAASVILTGSGTANGLRIQRSRFANLTVTGTIENTATVNSVDAVQIGENLIMTGPGQTSTATPAAFARGGYFTGTTVSQNRYGLIYAFLVKNSTVSYIGEQMLSQTRTAINVTAEHLPISVNGWHPDVDFIGLPNPGVPVDMANVIRVNVTATNDINFSCVFNDAGTGRVDRVAFVNCFYANIAYPYALRQQRPMDNVVWLGGGVSGGTVLLETSSNFATNSYSFIDFTYAGTLPTAIPGVRALP